jgi:hypothetical protein
MLYIPGVLNPTESLIGGRSLNIFLGGRASLLMLRLASILLSRPYVVWVYGMYFVEVGFFIGDVGPCYRFHGSYLLRGVSIVLEDGGEKF